MAPASDSAHPAQPQHPLLPSSNMHSSARKQQRPTSQSPLAPFLRAVGLDSLNVLASRIFNHNTKSEPKKLVKITSLWIAMQRCAVHVLPCAFSLFLAVFNFQGYFIGFELAGERGKTSQYMALLQIAAKVQELLIVASLTAVVAHRLRHDLIDGKGVPFGLVGAGSLFSQLSYFWSTAFIGSVTRNVRLNTTLVGLVMLSGFIAVTAGPAVAVLLIPREQTWSAGGSTYWINGTVDDLWPSRIGLEHYMPRDGNGLFGASCSSAEAYTNALCPAGGYLSLVNRLSSSDFYRPWSATKDSRYKPAELLIWSPLGQVPPYNMLSAQRARTALESSAIGIHGPASWVAAALNDDWQRAVDSIPASTTSSVSRYRYYSTMRSIIDTWVPAVRVVCSDVQSYVPGQKVLEFPVVPEYGPATRNYLIFDDENFGEPRELRTVQLSDATRESLQYTQSPWVSIIDLSNASWTTATTGIIFQRAWTGEASREVSSCVVDARWAKGAVSVGLAQAVQPETFSASESPRDPRISGNSYRAFDMFKSDLGPADTWRRIRVTKEWLDSINLPVFKDDRNRLSSNATILEETFATSNSSTNTTIISSLLALTTSTTFLIPGIEHTLAVTFADALARAGSWRVLNTTQPVIDRKYNPTRYHSRKPNYRSELLSNGEAYDNPALSSAETFTEFQMCQEITGYAFKTSSTTDILALVVIFLHLFVALAHSVVLLARRSSSSCWDSVPELLSLTQQSSQSTIALRNTAAGIEKLSSFQQRVRIRTSVEDAEHLELKFDADSDGKDTLGKPLVGQVYG